MAPPPPTLATTLAAPLLIPLEPLTPQSFAPFGTAISAPLSQNMNKPPLSPAHIPTPLHHPYQPAPVLANQNSALKTSPISIFENNYPSRSPGVPQMSLFSCFPRNLSGIGMVKGAKAAAERWEGTGKGESEAEGNRILFSVGILERHPYTTQTFSPLGLAADENDDDDDDEQTENYGRTAFLVIVAPTLQSSSPSQPHNPPDIRRLRAFVARGDQAVTYAAGTWHAPMVVLGSRRVDFLVTQFANGVADDDCQEVLLGANRVAVDVASVLRRRKTGDRVGGGDGLWSSSSRGRRRGRRREGRARL